MYDTGMYSHVCILTYVYSLMYTNVCILIYAYSCIHTYVYIHVYVYSRMYTYVCILTYVYIRMYTHVCILTYVYLRMYTPHHFLPKIMRVYTPGATGVDNGKGGGYENFNGMPHAVKIQGRTYRFLPRVGNLNEGFSGGLSYLLFDSRARLADHASSRNPAGQDPSYDKVRAGYIHMYPARMYTYVYICMSTYVCIHMYVYICMYTYVCIHMYVYICMYTYVCIRMYVYFSIHTYLCIHTVRMHNVYMVPFFAYSIYPKISMLHP
jgi:hypothetical protein